MTLLTLVAHNESLDPAAAFTQVAATPDPGHVAVIGDEVFIPSLNHVVAYGCAIDLTVASQARFRSPSLLERGIEEYVDPVASGLTFGADPEIHDLSQNPLQLVKGEGLTFEVNTNPALAAQHYAFSLLSDGVITPVKGRIMTVRFTAAVAQVVTGWTAGAMTLPASLAAGRYQVVGCRVLATNGVFYRLRFPGNPWRPGGVCANAQSDLDHPLFRRGALGVWGEFDNRDLPAIEILGVTDTTQVGWLDLIYLGK
jgi:hypothetical protein